uniref:Uncharacterized protein n=1 Tax=Peronospora matthiolae TaxID=2874970 RepID=A0AAV1V4V9_9STRA
MDEQLLNCVFRFKHKAPSDNQEAATCVALATYVAAFIADLQPTEAYELPCGRVEPLADDRVVPASAFAAHEVQVLKKVGECLVRASPRRGAKSGIGDVWCDPWLPKYGCAVQRTQLNAVTVRIEVVFADGWEQTLHFVPSGECIHSAVATTHHVVHCADLDMELAVKFSVAFDSELRNAQTSKGSKRSAARNELGHQKTPQFIAAVVRRAVTLLTKEANSVGIAPRGGTTDVGLHTGGQARDTCWAIVQAVIECNLCCGPGLFRKTMIAMKLKLLYAAVTNAKSTFICIGVKGGCALVDDLFYMLQVIIIGTAELVKCGYKVSMLE